MEGFFLNGDFENGTEGESSSGNFNLLLDTISTIIALVAVLGNGIVIAVMLLRRRFFSSFTNHLILHQSIIDTIAGVVFFLFNVALKPTSVVVSLEGNVYDELACRFLFSTVMVWSLNVTSTYNLVIISLDRFMATCHPVKYRNTWTISKLRYALATAWGVGFAYGSHALLVYEAHEGECRTVDLLPALQVLVGLFVVGTEFLVPVVIFIYAYARILLLLSKKLANGVAQNSLSTAKKNILVTTLLICIMFVICWTPSEVSYFGILVLNLPLDLTTHLAVSGLVACNMCANPIIYCFKYERFRKQLNDILQKRLASTRNRVGDGEPRAISCRLAVQMNTNESTI